MYRAAAGTHSFVVVTEWKEHRALDYALICRDMEKPACLSDGRNLLDHAALFELGFKVYAIGQAPRTH